jgi:hypothetical protein
MLYREVSSYLIVGLPECLNEIQGRPTQQNRKIDWLSFVAKTIGRNFALALLIMS